MPRAASVGRDDARRGAGRLSCLQASHLRLFPVKACRATSLPQRLARPSAGAERPPSRATYPGSMILDGEYAPSQWDWVRNQVDLYERSGGTEGLTLFDTGLPVVIVTMRGNRTGKIRKAPVMRVEHEGQYAIVASKGGDPKHPGWYYNLKARPDEVRIQDGPEVMDVTVREVDGEEREQWWERAVEAYPPYAEYQVATERRIPVFVATRKA